jgi:hypothetical protein
VVRKVRWRRGKRREEVGRVRRKRDILGGGEEEEEVEGVLFRFVSRCFVWWCCGVLEQNERLMWWSVLEWEGAAEYEQLRLWRFF